MQNQVSKRFFIANLLVALMLLGALATGLFWGLRTPVAFAQADTAAASRTITVVGEGKVSIKPDTAHANIGVEVIKPTVKEASAENKKAIASVLAALKAQGIAEKDIQTSGFSIYAERYSESGSGAGDQVRYHVTNNVQVVVRNLDKVGDVLDAAVEAGANNIYGVDFSLEDPSKVESAARSSAIANAKAKAQDLAKLTGVTVGDVVSVSEVVGGGGGLYASNFAKPVAQGLGGGGAPINPGELELTMQLQVVYAITK
jgi:uncharacterized protein YggE